ncbi:MAG TPA: DMT family transporter [Gemmatimonadaceae bacterium]|nr:DMT family transporter [Gemmatimonadaceae bacterium]
MTIGDDATTTGAGTVALTLLALIAFASNSLLTRLALGSKQIDAASFTAIRLVSGAIVLALLVRGQAGSWAPLRGRGVVGPLSLFLYAAPFSLAYLRIGAAVGALVLFGVVQLTMIGYGVARGERPTSLAVVGLVLAATGLAILTVPSVARPDPLGTALMVIAGVAWAAYSLAGRAAPNALATNARSFLLSSPFALLLVAFVPGLASASARGIVLAVVSGGVTSGLGYAIWYRALPRLTVTQAAVAQLSVPVIAALGAAAVLGERLTPRLGMAGVAVLGGVALVLASRSRVRALTPPVKPAEGRS